MKKILCFLMIPFLLLNTCFASSEEPEPTSVPASEDSLPGIVWHALCYVSNSGHYVLDLDFEGFQSEWDSFWYGYVMEYEQEYRGGKISSSALTSLYDGLVRKASASSGIYMILRPGWITEDLPENMRNVLTRLKINDKFADVENGTTYYFSNVYGSTSSFAGTINFAYYRSQLFRVDYGTNYTINASFDGGKTFSTVGNIAFWESLQTVPVFVDYASCFAYLSGQAGAYMDFNASKPTFNDVNYSDIKGIDYETYNNQVYNYITNNTYNSMEELNQDLTKQFQLVHEEIGKLNENLDDINDNLTDTLEGVKTSNKWLSKIYTMLQDILESLGKILDKLRDVLSWLSSDSLITLSPDFENLLNFGEEGELSTKISTELEPVKTLSKEKFPFSIPWDIYMLFSAIGAVPASPPVFDIPFHLHIYGMEIDETVHFDFSGWESLAAMSRIMLTGTFCLGLYKLTFKLISKN